MPVTAIKEYVAVPRDQVANFHGKQLVYVSWDRHLLFAAPFLICLPPETPFRELVEGPLKALVSPDPDAAAIDWQRVEWLKSNQPWTPDFDASLAANGIGHKDQLRMCTAGLNSLAPAA
ncbi:phenol 2-monooxygenase subunit p4 [Azoarcus olearius]|uniref:phenol hydroxylase subunit P4 n=1 Tax=Azoarcus sp. (strain BH72) TaxID=418699 RepID=UPI00080632D1|nr:phenol hydroxylase subunit P4 [Azoarcus olearius]ANQ85037.1 phenol 2-monooxygenase subunit p4 [Azoarcus olearius]